MRRLFVILCLFLSLVAQAQIVNSLKVDQPTFLLYAQARMQPYNPANLALADSLYQVGVRKGNLCYKCLALSLEMPVRFERGEYERMDVIAAELKGLLGKRKDLREFYFDVWDQYNEFLLKADRVSEAVLEARAMERLSLEERNPLGRMYAYRIIGLIQSYRNNSYLAEQNLEEAVRFCREARAEQELPNLFILLAQEQMKMGQFTQAHQSCTEAASYQDFFPGLEQKVLITRALIYYAQGDLPAFNTCYQLLQEDPLYPLQTDIEDRTLLDITYLRSQGQLEEALVCSKTLQTRRNRLEQQYHLYAGLGDYDKAYDCLFNLMEEKDSLFIKVQNEDVAILDAEMDNAQLREEAQRMKAHNQFAMLMGFFLMFVAAFLAVLVHQWRVRDNLERMKAQQNSMLMARRAFQQALNAKEAENALKIKLLQNKEYNSTEL
ncbi:MAG: hypothetical protein E7109_00460 [Bacteroidales bacterium]|nr:hypothetical protein [Bacteroidales bacterium]